MRSHIHDASEPPALAPMSNGAGTLQAPGGPDQAASSQSSREPFGRFRRSRSDVLPGEGGRADEDELALGLQVMLLSEENARLKAERHRPADVGTLIDQMRELGQQEGPGEVLDEAWTMLSECLVMRQGLEQACIEIQAAIGAVRDRLGSLTVRLDGVMPTGGAQSAVDPRQSFPSR